MGAYGNATPPLLKAIFFDYRFDLTKKIPLVKILSVQTVMLHLLYWRHFFLTTDLTWPTLTSLPKFHGCNLSRYTCVKWYFRSMQIWLDVFDPPPKFHRCISSCYTCVKWYFRSMQIWLDVFDPLPKFHRCNLLRYTCVKWYFRSMQIWLDIFDPPAAKILRMHFITLHHSHSTSQHPATPDTTKTTCYRSAAQCWKAFLVVMTPQTT